MGIQQCLKHPRYTWISPSYDFVNMCHHHRHNNNKKNLWFTKSSHITLFNPYKDSVRSMFLNELVSSVFINQFFFFFLSQEQWGLVTDWEDLVSKSFAFQTLFWFPGDSCLTFKTHSTFLCMRSSEPQWGYKLFKNKEHIQLGCLLFPISPSG